MCSILFRLSDMGAQQEGITVAMCPHLFGNLSLLSSAWTYLTVRLVLYRWRNSGVHGRHIRESPPLSQHAEPWLTRSSHISTENLPEDEH